MRGCVSIPAFRFLPILVFVCDHSFMLFRKCTLNSSISLCHSSFYVFHTFSFRRNRVMNGQNHAMAMYPFACTWQDFKRTVDCNGNNCQLQVICQLKRPFFEISHVSGESTCSFREKRLRIPRLSANLLLAEWSPVLFWDPDRSTKMCPALSHAFPTKWYLTQAFFHHPLEISFQMNP